MSLHRIETRLRRMRAEQERDEANAALSLVYDDRDRLRAQIAALREAARPMIADSDDCPVCGSSGASDVPEDERPASYRILKAALADTEAAAREHDARIRAKALREAADVCEREATDCSTATGSYIAGRCEAKLRALADEAERGAR